MDRVEAGVGQQQGVGIGQSNILGGKDDQTPGNEPGLLAAGEHPGQVVDRGVGVTSPDRFDKGRNDIVVLLAVLVVEGDVLLQTLGYVVVGDRNLAGGGVDDDFENVQQLAGIAAREAEQRLGLLYFDLALLQLEVGLECPVEQCLQLLVVHRLQNVDLTATQ